MWATFIGSSIIPEESSAWSFLVCDGNAVKIISINYFTKLFLSSNFKKLFFVVMELLSKLWPFSMTLESQSGLMYNFSFLRQTKTIFLPISLKANWQKVKAVNFTSSSFLQKQGWKTDVCCRAFFSPLLYTFKFKFKF